MQEIIIEPNIDPSKDFMKLKIDNSYFYYYFTNKTNSLRKKSIQDKIQEKRLKFSQLRTDISNTFNNKVFRGLLLQEENFSLVK